MGQQSMNHFFCKVNKKQKQNSENETNFRHKEEQKLENKENTSLENNLENEEEKVLENERAKNLEIKEEQNVENERAKNLENDEEKNIKKKNKNFEQKRKSCKRKQTNLFDFYDQFNELKNRIDSMFCEIEESHGNGDHKQFLEEIKQSLKN